MNIAYWGQGSMDDEQGHKVGAVGVVIRGEETKSKRKSVNCLERWTMNKIRLDLIWAKEKGKKKKHSAQHTHHCSLYWLLHLSHHSTFITSFVDHHIICWSLINGKWMLDDQSVVLFCFVLFRFAACFTFVCLARPEVEDLHFNLLPIDQCDFPARAGAGSPTGIPKCTYACTVIPRINSSPTYTNLHDHRHSLSQPVPQLVLPRHVTITTLLVHIVF